ncbi:MAG: NUDIX hydrolase [Thermoprotei archaeon]
MEDRWVRETGRLSYKSEYFEVHTDTVRLPNGSKINFDWYTAHDFCVIVALKGGRLIAIENYRYPADGWFLELPAGHIEGEEKPEEAALRELEEETGYRAQNPVYLGWYYVSSRSLQRGHVVFCSEPVKTEIRREESELQRVKLITPRHLENKIKSSEVKHAATIIAYTIAKSRGLV